MPSVFRPRSRKGTCPCHSLCVGENKATSIYQRDWKVWFPAGCHVPRYSTFTEEDGRADCSEQLRVCGTALRCGHYFLIRK